MTRRHAPILGVVVALVLAACAGDDGGSSAADAGPLVTDRAFETFGGEEATLRELADQPLIVNFWASWCPPCIAEMPAFEQVHRDRGDEVRFIGVNTQDGLAQAEALVDQTGVTYELGLDPDGALFNDFEVVAMPSTYLVNGAGAVVHRHAGILSEDRLQELIEEHLVG